MSSNREDAPPGLHRYPPFDTALARIDSLPRKQARLARALLDEPEVIAFGSIRDVAARLDVNAATVLRFAQILGYSGYQSLQAAVRQAYLRYAGLQPPAEERLFMQSGTVLGHLRTHQRLDLDRLYERLEEDELQSLCDDLEAARRVLVCGDGAAVALGALFVRLLHHVGVHAELLSNGAADNALELAGLSERDVVVGIAVSPTFRSTVDTLRLARAAGSRTVAITGSVASPLAAEADHVVVAPSQGLGLSFSVLPAVALLETVIAILAGRRPDVVARLRQTLHEHYASEGLIAEPRDRSRPAR